MTDVTRPPTGSPAATDVVVVGENIVVGLKIHANPAAERGPSGGERWQVLSVDGGRVSEIRGYEKRHDATTFATSGVSQWST